MIQRILISLCSHKLEEEFEWLKKSEVLYYSVEKKGNVSSQLKHYNPWSMKCHQQQLQRMKENAKHRNQYSILCSQERGRQEGPRGSVGQVGFFKLWLNLNFSSRGATNPYVLAGSR